jgi:hypothetical protein
MSSPVRRRGPALLVGFGCLESGRRPGPSEDVAHLAQADEHGAEGHGRPDHRQDDEDGPLRKA